MKNKYVVFHPEGTRIYTGRKPRTKDPMVKNPDMLEIRAIPVQDWELVDGQVRPKWLPGRKIQLISHAQKRVKTRKTRIRLILMGFSIGLGAGTVLAIVLAHLL